MTDEQIIEGFMRAKMAADTPDDIDWQIYEAAFWGAVSAHPEIFERLEKEFPEYGEDEDADLMKHLAP